MKYRAVIDYETRSELDVGNVGGVKYSLHPSTDVMFLGVKFEDETPFTWQPGEDIESLSEILLDQNVQLIAHNSLFEYCITHNVLKKYLRFDSLKIFPLKRWKCTAAKAAASALPRNLKGAALALNLPVRKDMDGHRLMLKHTKPRAQWKEWALNGRQGPEPVKWHTNEFERWAIQDYCLSDVIVEDLLDKKLPDLTPFERMVWEINQEMNLRGIKIDVPTVAHMIKLTEELVRKYQKRAEEITSGSVTSLLQRDALLDWLHSIGVDVKDLRAATVRALLEKKDLNPTARVVLEMRQAVSKTSTAKFKAMIVRADKRQRVSDLALYHGASTGREAGRGLQIQNLPRGSVKDTNLAIEIIKNCESIDDVHLYFKKPMDVFSSCIRGMITSSDGHELAVADYNAIECRVLNWVAKNEETLEDFRLGKDLYKKMASRIFSKPESEVDDDQRFIGKQVVLGCGYGMGAKKFVLTCANLGKKDVPLSLAEKAVKIYRDSHQLVTQAWYNVEQAAIKAAQYPGRMFSVNRTTWWVERGFLLCKLPSGRNLSFYGPQVKNEPTPWGVTAPKLYYWRVDSLTKKWVFRATYGGSLVESICQATARDITVNGIVNVTKAGYQYLFQVHDEVISERQKVDVDEYVKLLTTLPAWAEGLPVKAGGWKGLRYKK